MPRPGADPDAQFLAKKGESAAAAGGGSSGGNDDSVDSGSEPHGLKVTVRTVTGRKFELQAERTDTVGMAKAMIQSQGGPPRHEQRILLANEELQDDRTLADCGIEPESALSLVLRLAPPPPTVQPTVSPLAAQLQMRQPHELQGALLDPAAAADSSFHHGMPRRKAEPGVRRFLLGLLCLCVVCLAGLSVLWVSVRRDIATLQHHGLSIQHLDEEVHRDSTALQQNSLAIQDLEERTRSNTSDHAGILRAERELSKLQQRLDQIHRMALLGQPVDAAAICRGPYLNVTDGRRWTNASAPAPPPGQADVNAGELLCDDHIAGSGAPWDPTDSNPQGSWVRFSGQAGQGLATFDPRSVKTPDGHPIAQACGTTRTGMHL